MYRRLKILAEHARELDRKLLETRELFGNCANIMSQMEEISTKVKQVFTLYRELVGLLK